MSYTLLGIPLQNRSCRFGRFCGCRCFYCWKLILMGLQKVIKRCDPKWEKCKATVKGGRWIQPVFILDHFVSLVGTCLNIFLFVFLNNMLYGIYWCFLVVRAEDRQAPHLVLSCKSVISHQMTATAHSSRLPCKYCWLLPAWASPHIIRLRIQCPFAPLKTPIRILWGFERLWARSSGIICFIPRMVEFRAYRAVTQLA